MYGFLPSSSLVVNSVMRWPWLSGAAAIITGAVVLFS
jgi:hypothetical protein